MRSTSGVSTKPSPASDPQPRHGRDELAQGQLSGFHVRWYSHESGHTIGPFASFDEVAVYMTEHHLPRPDELLVSVDAAKGVQ